MRWPKEGAILWLESYALSNSSTELCCFVLGTIKKTSHVIYPDTSLLSCFVLLGDMTSRATQLPPFMCGDFWFISAAIWKTEPFLNFAGAAFHQEFFKVVGSFPGKIWFVSCLLTRLNCE